MIDIDKINKEYNTNIKSVTRSELEQKLIEVFGSFGYSSFTYEGKTTYTIGVKFEWECYEYNSDNFDTETLGQNSLDEAITYLFIKYKDEYEFEQIIKDIERIPY